MSDSAFITKETNEIIKVALTGDNFNKLLTIVANQLPFHNVVVRDPYSVHYDEFYSAIHEMVERFLNHKPTDTESGTN
ncbi:hypothetical protein CS369_02700 [Candidatus Symbiopectobacterium sp. 'North America']|uniref:hypothetical protein n=1 Tax=Candidatus Symbiopectobacterium sp. 'North America' TaxID=2794574 RepID=UPI0018CB0412|nr:hypothetical protein [Candidatus Symbiopectobacterium sp. 'North America']MBG6244007.1 hypothetical protein [Candidatus Symbiopectobacterium sp. 'North America']